MTLTFGLRIVAGLLISARPIAAIAQLGCLDMYD